MVSPTWWSRSSLTNINATIRLSCMSIICYCLIIYIVCIVCNAPVRNVRNARNACYAYTVSNAYNEDNVRNVSRLCFAKYAMYVRKWHQVWCNVCTHSTIMSITWCSQPVWPAQAATYVRFTFILCALQPVGAVCYALFCFDFGVHTQRLFGNQKRFV